MRKVLIGIVIIAAVIGGLGFYLGWFSVHTTDSSFKVKVNQGQIEDDKDKVKDKVEDLTKK